MDFYAAVLYALQGANWQRAHDNSKPQPEHLTRPREDNEGNGEEFSGADELVARKQHFYDELERRRNLAKGEQSG
jgi:hypothetical protein